MQERDMKRSREQVRSLPDGGKKHGRGHAPAQSRVHIASPDSAASVVSPRDPRALEEKSNKTSWRSRKGSIRTSQKPIVPFRPPPLVKPFRADSEGDGDGEVNSLSSPIDGKTAPEPKPKRRRRDEMEERPEEEAWRKVAEGILAGAPVSVGEGTSKKNFAVVCSSNVNRSIMAQKLLKKNDMRAKSYGTGSQVKLPGKNSKSPQAFAFGTPYLEIYDSLVRLDEALFRRNSVLGLLQRDAVTKRAPERWQALEGEEVASFDVVVCFESRVFDLVVEDLQQRDPETFKPLHIVSMTIRDSAEESAAAEGDVLELCKMLDACEDLNSEASSLLNGFRMKTKRTVLHQVCHI